MSAESNSDIVMVKGRLYIQKAGNHNQRTLFPHTNFGMVEIKMFSVVHRI